MTEELWKKVKQNENYWISNYGNIRRKKLNGEWYNLKGSIQKTNGYKYANITDISTKKRKMLYLHNLVLEAFKGQRPEQTNTSGRWVCDHKNRNKLDNRVDNLDWVTELENLRNTPHYNTEIATTDPKERRKELRKWRKKNPDRVIKRSKCGHIKQMDENKFWCIVGIKGKKYKKMVYGDKEKAEKYCKFMKEYYS
jgi:hypothetical protein